jgi:hypothetical protein
VPEPEALSARPDRRLLIVADDNLDASNAECTSAEAAVLAPGTRL